MGATMKKLRIAVLDDNALEGKNYEKLCRELCEKQGIAVETKVYEKYAALEFDLDDSSFCKRLNIVLFAISEKNNLEAVLALRETGYAGLIIIMGEESCGPDCEKLFDAETFNFVKTEMTERELERFQNVLKKAVKTVVKSQIEKLVVSYGGKVKQIDMNDIMYFHVQDKTSTVYCEGGESFSFIAPISKMEVRLRGKDFIRCAKSYLVSAASIVSLTHSEAMLKDGTIIRIGRRYYNEVENLIMKERRAHDEK
jgi:DNA-binding LytR/AlgR family response regulator